MPVGLNELEKLMQRLDDSESLRWARTTLAHFSICGLL
jgi:hypothetical protein